MKYEKFDVLKKAKFSAIPHSKELYLIHVECDANDGDYMRDTLEYDKESFEEDELLLLVLSYVGKYSGKFSEEKGWRHGYYGHHVSENEDFPWLEEYLQDNYILIYAGMCDMPCHSVSSIDITYYDDNGIANKVELPDVDNLFESKEEFVNYLNKLYEEWN